MEDKIDEKLKGLVGAKSIIEESREKPKPLIKWYMVAILLLLVVSSFTLYKVLTRIEIFENQPLYYGLKQVGIDTCTCINIKGDTVMLTQDSIKIQQNQYG